MNGHQGIWASLASNRKQLLNSRQVTLNPLAFLFEFYIYESVVQYKTPSLTGVENKINEGKDNQSINQSSINHQSINQSVDHVKLTGQISNENEKKGKRGGGDKTLKQNMSEHR